jgi:hypothetical protein
MLLTKHLGELGGNFWSHDELERSKVREEWRRSGHTRMTFYGWVQLRHRRLRTPEHAVAKSCHITAQPTFSNACLTPRWCIFDHDAIGSEDLVFCIWSQKCAESDLLSHMYRFRGGRPFHPCWITQYAELHRRATLCPKHDFLSISIFLVISLCTSWGAISLGQNCGSHINLCNVSSPYSKQSHFL